MRIADLGPAGGMSKFDILLPQKSPPKRGNVDHMERLFLALLRPSSQGFQHRCGLLDLAFLAAVMRRGPLEPCLLWSNAGHVTAPVSLQGRRWAFTKTLAVCDGEAPRVREATRVRDRRDIICWRRGLQCLAGGPESAICQELHGGVATKTTKGFEECASAALALHDEVGNGDRLGCVCFNEFLDLAHHCWRYGSLAVACQFIAVVVGQRHEDIQQHLVKASPKDRIFQDPTVLLNSSYK